MLAARGLRDRSYWRNFRERFGLGPFLATSPIWVHAVSVGEVQAAAALVVALELVAISLIRKRFLAVPLRTSLLQVALGGAMIVGVGVGFGVAIGPQRADKFRQQRKCVAERLQVDDLTADMHVDAGDDEAGQLCRPRIDGARMRERDAELVL